MDRDGIGQLQFIEFIELIGHLALSKADHNLFFLPVHGADASDVPVEDLLIIVIGGLDDLVADTKETPVGLILIPVFAARV